MTEIVLIEATPGRYSVRLGNEIIVKSSRDPEHDAARALMARGIIGRMTTLSESGKPRMHFVIEQAAGLSVQEDNFGLKVRPYRPFPRGDVDAQARYFHSEAAE